MNESEYKDLLKDLLKVKEELKDFIPDFIFGLEVFFNGLITDIRMFSTRYIPKNSESLIRMGIIWKN